MKFGRMFLLLAASFASGQSGDMLLRLSPGRTLNPDTATTFERWVKNRYLQGRKLVILTDNPEHELVKTIQKEMPEVVLILPSQALSFSDFQRENPLIVLIGSKAWCQSNYDKLSVYVSIREDRILPILLTGQSLEDSLPGFARRYRAVRLLDGFNEAQSLAKQIAREVVIRNNTNFT